MKFKRDQAVIESGNPGVIVQSGPVSYDIVWAGGSTSRYRYSVGRHVRLLTAFELDELSWLLARLAAEAAKIRAERLAARHGGPRYKRGQIWPSR